MDGGMTCIMGEYLLETPQTNVTCFVGSLMCEVRLYLS